MDSDSKSSETSLDLNINLFRPTHRYSGGTAEVDRKRLSPTESVDLLLGFLFERRINDGGGLFSDLISRFGLQSSSNLAMEVGRISSETKQLTQLMNSVKQKCLLLQNQVMEWKSKNLEREKAHLKKRKAEGEDHYTEPSSSDEEQKPKTKVRRVFVQTDAFDASLIMKDGHQWRKYGEKVTRDNPSPRAYYKCSFSTCPVKKKVQRSAEDPSMLIAVYDGEHNHTEICGNEFALPQNLGAHLASFPFPPLTRPLKNSSFASSGSDRLHPTR